MQITNGSVTRAYKVADYETRTVSLSFTIDPGEDAEACTAQVRAMAERQVKGEAVQAKEPTAAPNPPPSVVVTIAPTAVDTTASASPSTSEVVITDNQLKMAADAARARQVDALVIKQEIAKHVETPGMSMYTLPQEKRPAMLAAINALGKAAVAQDDY